MARKKLGALLADKGLITEIQLVAALSYQRKWKIKLGKALQELGYLEEKVLFEVLAEQLKMELVDLYETPIPVEIKRKISREKGMALMAMPVKVEGDTLVVAVSEPDREKLRESLEKITDMDVKLVLALGSQIEEMVRTLPEKISVASIKPAKKVFRKNEHGAFEPMDTGDLEPDLLPGDETLVPKIKKEDPLPVDNVELKTNEASVPENDEPVELEEVEPELPAEPKEEPKASPGKLAFEVPDVDLGAPAPEKADAEPKPEELVEEPPAVSKPECGEDTEEFWNGAETAKPADEVETAEKESTPEPEADKLDDYFPGQMRSMEPDPEETFGEVKKAEERVQEPEPELKPEEEVEELKILDVEKSVELKEEAGLEEFPLPPMQDEQDIGKDEFAPPLEPASAPEPEPEMAPEPEKGKWPEEKSEPKQSIRPQAASQKSAPLVSGVEREIILNKIMEIEQKMKALACMIEELREKIQS